MVSAKPSVEDQLQTLMRGVEYGDRHIHQTMHDELRDRLREGRPLRVYCGFDPTAVDLHLGHLVPMLKMRQFQRLGHEVTFLIGTMTAVIGDPTDRNAARQMLSAEQVEENAHTWLRQAFRVLDPQKTIVKRNGDWLAPMSLADIVQIASNFTVQQFLDHETFRRRIDAQRPIYLHEFIYALLQGQDAVATETDVQIGGTEQLFNILAGRTLQKAKGQKPQIAVCLPILMGTDGRLRMAKSTGNYIGLDESPKEMYGKVMSIPDGLTLHYFTLLTDVPGDELGAVGERLQEGGGKAMEQKKRLAREVVAMLHSADAARQVEEEFERVFQRREEPESSATLVAWESLPRMIAVPPGPVLVTPEEAANLAEAIKYGQENPSIKLATFLNQQLGISLSQARRLIEQGAVSIDGERCENLFPRIHPGALIRVGKSRFFKIEPPNQASA